MSRDRVLERIQRTLDIRILGFERRVVIRLSHFPVRAFDDGLQCRIFQMRFVMTAEHGGFVGRVIGVDPLLGGYPQLQCLIVTPATKVSSSPVMCPRLLLLNPGTKPGN